MGVATPVLRSFFPITRLEAAAAAGFTAHAALVWGSADTGMWAWSMGGILGLLGILACHGLVRPGDPGLTLVRGGLALSTLLLVGELAGAVPGPLDPWFAVFALAYALVLPRRSAVWAPAVVAGTCLAVILLGAEPAPLGPALARSLPVLGVGVAAFGSGALVRRVRGEQDCARDRLRQVEDRLRTVMTGAPVVLFAVDEHGVLTLCEGQGLAALGLTPGEVVGRSVFEMQGGSPGMAKAVRRALGGEAFAVTLEVGPLAFETRFSPMWEGGRVAGAIAVAHDVTEQVRVANRLRRLVRSKDEFVAAVSHELRTPLTAVVGFAHELRDGLDRLQPEEIRSFVGLIGDQATEVADLVEDLLVASRLDSDGVAVSREATMLWEQAEAVLVARRLGIPVITLRPDREAKVYGDPVRIRQVVRNLLTNAERYGGPHILVRVDRLGEEYALSVVDDGAGIPEPDRARVFEPYCRAHRKEGCTESVGLGLTVSRRLARLMGGDLTYDYRDGQSVFTMTLPAV